MTIKEDLIKGIFILLFIVLIIFICAIDTTNKMNCHNTCLAEGLEDYAVTSDGMCYCNMNKPLPKLKAIKLK